MKGTWISDCLKVKTPAYPKSFKKELKILFGEDIILYTTHHYFTDDSCSEGKYGKPDTWTAKKTETRFKTKVNGETVQSYTFEMKRSIAGGLELIYDGIAFPAVENNQKVIYFDYFEDKAKAYNLIQEHKYVFVE